MQDLGEIEKMHGLRKCPCNLRPQVLDVLEDQQAGLTGGFRGGHDDTGDPVYPVQGHRLTAEGGGQGGGQFQGVTAHDDVKVGRLPAQQKVADNPAGDVGREAPSDQKSGQPQQPGAHIGTDR